MIISSTSRYNIRDDSEFNEWVTNYKRAIEDELQAAFTLVTKYVYKVFRSMFLKYKIHYLLKCA